MKRMISVMMLLSALMLVMVRCNSGEWNQYYDGTLEDIPDEYRINCGMKTENQWDAAIEDALQSAMLTEPEFEMEV